MNKESIINSSNTLAQVGSLIVFTGSCTMLGGLLVFFGYMLRLVGLVDLQGVFTIVGALIVVASLPLLIASVAAAIVAFSYAGLQQLLKNRKQKSINNSLSK